MQGASRALLVSGCILTMLMVAGGSLHHLSNPVWRPATATWYGEQFNGDGSDGGALAYSSMENGNRRRVSPVLFMNGKGWGACYKIKCLYWGICSRRAVKVITTDMCLDGVCTGGRTHFNLSGDAFSGMAVPGQGSQLRHRGLIPVVYRRTPCKYAGNDVSFHLNEGSTHYWLSPLVKGRDRDIREVLNPATLPQPAQAPQMAANPVQQVQASQPPQSQQVPQYQQQWPQPPPVQPAQPQLVQSQSQIAAPPQEQLPSSIPMQMPAPGAPQQGGSQADAVPYGYGGTGRPLQTQPPRQPMKVGDAYAPIS